MDIKLELGPNFELLQEGLRKAPQQTISAIGEGMGVATKDVADAVAREIISGASGLHSRSGALAESITNYPDTFTNLTWYIGVGDNQGVMPYAWLLTDDQKTITPTRGTYLAIPSGDNKDGVYFQSPRDVPGGFFVHPAGGGVYFGDDQGGTFRLLFTMVREVLVQGFGLLPDIARDKSMYVRHNDMIKLIRRTVRHRLSEIGLN